MTRCRRHLHLDNDPAMRDVTLPPPDMGVQRRTADAAAHRAQIARTLAAEYAAVEGWVTVPRDAADEERVRHTLDALYNGASYVSGALLPDDDVHGRSGAAELLVRPPDGYSPVIVVRHRITDPGDGAVTTRLPDLDPVNATTDSRRKLRSHPRDQLRLAHLYRMLQQCGVAEPACARGGVIGLDADVVVWYDLDAVRWPGKRSTLVEYDARFADRQAV